MAKREREQEELRSIILVDVSGSMYDQIDDVVNGINLILKGLYTAAKSVWVTIIAFNNKSSTVFDGIVTEDSPRLYAGQLHAIGTTALFDTLAKVLQMVEVNTTIVIATDGRDTASRTFTEERVKKLINAVKVDFGTKFIFLAQGEDAFCTGKGLGFDDATQVAQGETLGSTLQDSSFVERVLDMTMTPSQTV